MSKKTEAELEEAAKEILAKIIDEGKRVYKDGMTEDEWKQEMLGGMEISKAPDWLNDILDRMPELDIC